MSCRAAYFTNPRKPSPNAIEECPSKVRCSKEFLEVLLILARFTEWAKIYGGIYSLKLGTGTMVVLTDRRLIKQRIDKKSSIYSNRPPSYVGNGLITGGDHLLVMDYGNHWRAYRRLVHKYFMESEVASKH